MTPLQFNDLLISFTTEFLPQWDDQSSGAYKAVSLWRPSTTSNELSQYFALGDIATTHYRNINQRKVVAVVSDANRINGTALRPPEDYHRVWKDTGSGARNDFSIWRPLPPQGYVALGLVCGVGYDKPSRNAVRCVRADLVVKAQCGQLIWDDKGSGATKDFSIWSITPPRAAPGEIHLAPGTFTGSDRYTRPSEATYSLRLSLPAVFSDALPAPCLTGHEEPEELQSSTSTQHCLLPWFCVKDPQMNAVEQLHNCDTYRLERIDRHVLTAFGHNPSTVSSARRWVASKGETGQQAGALSVNSSVELCKEWPTGTRSTELAFCAHLDETFTHTQHSAKGWNQPSTFEIFSYIPPGKAIAAYLLHSEYRLLRQDGSQVSGAVSYINGDEVYMSEYPASTPAGTDEPPVLPELPELSEELPTPALEVTPGNLGDDTLVT